MTAANRKPPSRSRRAELQRELGDVGEVLERQNHGTVDMPAQGWYALVAATGDVVFLGDYTAIALNKIRTLVHEHR